MVILVRRGGWIVPLLLLAACGDNSTPASRSSTPTTARPPGLTTSTIAPSTTTTTEAELGRFAVWFPEAKGNTITPETRVGAADIRGMLRVAIGGPLSPTLRPCLDRETQILTVTVDGSTAKLELRPPPPDFVSAQSVATTVGGAPGGELVEINGQVIAVGDAAIPEVVGDEPGPNEEIRSPLRVSGNAIAFEATVNVFLRRTGHGEVIAQTHTSTGRGDQRAPFEVALKFSVSQRTEAELAVYSAYGAVGEDSYSRVLPVVLLPE